MRPIRSTGRIPSRTSTRNTEFSRAAVSRAASCARCRRRRMPQPSALAARSSLPRQMVDRWRRRPGAPRRRSPGRGRNRRRAGGDRRVPRRRRDQPGEGHAPGRDRLFVAGSASTRPRPPTRWRASTCSRTSTRSCRTQQHARLAEGRARQAAQEGRRRPSGRWRTIRRGRTRCPSTIARTSSSLV